MAPLVPRVVKRDDVTLWIQALHSMPLPESLTRGVYFHDHVRPHPFLARHRVPAFDLGRQSFRHPLNCQVDGPARLGPPGIVVMVNVAVLPDLIPTPVNLHHDTALEPLPRLEPVPHFIP